MGNKKTNPNRIPVRWSEADTRRATDETTQEAILRAWMLVLCALGSRWDTTTESLLGFWNTVNNGYTKLQSVDDIEKRLDSLADFIGIRFPFHRINTSNIRSKSAVARLYSKLLENSLHAMFALIADTVIQQDLMDRDMICRLFWKVQDMSLDIKQGNLTDEDLLGVLKEEYSLHIFYRDGNVVLEPLDILDTALTAQAP